MGAELPDHGDGGEGGGGAQDGAGVRERALRRAPGARAAGPHSALLLFVGTLVLGGLAGYVVAHNTGLDYQSVGPATGILSYIFASLILTLVGFRGDLSEEISALGGYLIGSGLGAKLWDYLYPYVDEEPPDAGDG